MACGSQSKTVDKCERLRLILVGKTGVGKSSLGNVLLEKNDITQEEVQNTPDEGFTVNHGFESGTISCCSKIGHNNILDRDLEIIDTPGLFDTDSRSDAKKLKEFTKMLSLSVPGPHAFLFLMRCDVKFTKEEKEAFSKIKGMFSEEVLKHIIIVFTHGENLKSGIGKYIERAPSNLKKILDHVGNNYAVMSKTEDMDRGARELSDLFRKVDKVSTHGTQYYIDALLKKLHETIEEDAKQKMISECMSYEKALMLTMEDINCNEKKLEELMVKTRSTVIETTIIGIIVGSVILGGIRLLIR